MNAYVHCGATVSFISNCLKHKVCEKGREGGTYRMVCSPVLNSVVVDAFTDRTVIHPTPHVSAERGGDSAMRSCGKQISYTTQI